MTTSVRVPMTVTYRPATQLVERQVVVVEELEPVGYLRVFRRPNGQFLHVSRLDVLSVDGAPQ